MEELKIRRHGVVLAASYSPGGATAIVALHGASDGTRDSPLYSHLHALLPSAGIGVVTFDRRGEGESGGDSTRGQFRLQAEDALAVIDAIDAERVGLWGFSQGSWIGPLAAAISDEVAFLVLIASTGVTPSEQMMYAVERQLRLAGYDDNVIARALRLRRRFEEWVHARVSVRDDQLAAELRAAVIEPWWRYVWLPPTLLDEDGQRRWIEEMDFDPRPIFERVRVPTLLFYGEADSWIPLEPSIQAWRKARGSEADIVVLDKAAHDLTLPDGTLSAEYQRTLVEWLVSQRARPGPA